MGLLLRVLAVVGVVTCGGSFERLSLEPGVAQAGKPAPRRSFKRGKVLRGKRPMVRKGAIAALPPLRDAGGASTSVMLATAGAPATTSSPPSTAVAGSVGKSAAPPPAPVGKGAAALTLRKKKGPPSDDDLMEDAQAAYVRGDRGKAIELALVVAEKSNDRSPSAWKFIGLAACSVRSYRLATRAYQGVKTPYDQRAIVDACKYNGLAYKGDQFVGE